MDCLGLLLLVVFWVVSMVVAFLYGRHYEAGRPGGEPPSGGDGERVNRAAMF